MGPHSPVILLGIILTTAILLSAIVKENPKPANETTIRQYRNARHTTSASISPNTTLAKPLFSRKSMGWLKKSIEQIRWSSLFMVVAKAVDQTETIADVFEDLLLLRRPIDPGILYEGCYKVKRPIRHFNLSPGNYDYDSIDPVQCMYHCGQGWNYGYAGVTQGAFCFCASSLPDPVNRVDDSFCSEPCTGDPTEKCGSLNHISVYKTKRSIRDLHLQIQPKEVVQVGANVDFVVSYHSGPEEVVYAFDYGEGAGRMAANNTGMLSKTYQTPGDYIVTVYANEYGGEPDTESKFSRKVTVQTPVEGVNFMCPESAKSGEKISANVTISSGSFPKISVDYGDQYTDSFRVRDVQWFYAGPGVPSHGTQAAGSVAGKAYIMPSSQFQSKGILQGWEVYTASSGSVKMLLLRPGCTGANEYCFKTNDCRTAASCPNPHRTTCSGSDNFCAPRGVCVDATTKMSADCTATVNRYSGSTAPEYSVVEVESITLGGTGPEWHRTTLGEIAIEAGDVIGYIATAGTIATRTADASEQADEIATGVSSAVAGDVFATKTGTLLRHLARGAASRPNVAKFFHVYRVDGIYTLDIEIQNEYINAPVVKANCSILIAEGINVTELIAPEFAATFSDVTFDLAVHSGSNITYTWDFDDGTPEIVTETPYIDHEFLAHGCYNVSVVAENLMDRNENSTIICIEDLIINLALSTNNTSEVNVENTFYLTADSGSDYTCTWDWGDGSLVEASDSFITPITHGPNTHIYTAPTPITQSPYAINVTCMNNISVGSFVLQHRAQLPILGLDLEKYGAETATDFLIGFFITQGTDPTFNLEFAGLAVPTSFDVATLEGTTTPTLRRDVTAVYTVVMTAINDVSQVDRSFNFTVETPVRGMTLVKDIDQELITGDNVTFTVDCLQGSSVEQVWDFKDGSKAFTQIDGLLEDWSGSQTLVHTFKKPGEFNVSVTLSNNINSVTLYSLVIVLSGIDNVTFHNDAPVAFLNREATARFWLDVDGMPPTGAWTVFDFKDGIVTAPVPFEEGLKYTHKFTASGLYNVMAYVYNAIDRENFTIPTWVVEPVSNLNFNVKPFHAPLNVEVSVCVSMDQGQGVTITWDFGDGTEPIEAPRVGMTAYDSDCKVHMYTAIGTYEIVVTASNLLGNTSKIYQILAQEPVLADFGFTSSAPQKHPPGKVDFTLSYPWPGVLPTASTITVDFGDGSDPITFPMPFTEPGPYSYTFDYEYPNDGDFVATCIVSNMASSASIKTSSGAYAEIFGLASVAKYQPLLPIGGPEITPSDSFPLHREVHFHMSHTEGTVVSYTLLTVRQDSGEVACNHTTCIQTSNPVVFKFPKSGTYDVTIRAVNPLFDQSITKTIQVGAAVTGTLISDGRKITLPNEVKAFTISFETIGIDACVGIDFDDGYFEFYGPSIDVCPKIACLVSPSEYSNCMYIRPIEANEKALSVSHVYKKRATYKMTVEGFSLLGDDTANLQFVVSATKCYAPYLDIENRASQFYSPIEILRKKSFTVTGKIQLECDVTLENIKSWQIEEINPITGEKISEVTKVSSLDTVHNTQIAIPARFLPYGLYRFIFRVEISGKDLPKDEVFSTEVDTYYKIVQSPLVGLMTEGGMSLITAGHGKMLTLKPADYSFDPDLDDDEPQTFDRFDWKCRQVDEVYPDVDNPSSPLTEEELEPYLNSSSNSLIDHGGCFRQGPGSIDLDIGEITFITSNMHENETYIFDVTVHKGDRSASASLLIDILPGDSPFVSIRVKDELWRPIQGGIEVQASNRLALVGECQIACSADCQYSWSMFRLGLHNSWLEIEAEELEAYATGLNSREFSISSDLFAAGFALWEDLLEYRVRFTAQEPGGLSGMAYTVLKLNTAPTVGNCSISPQTGYINTEWNISCSGFQDEDGIQHYTFYCRNALINETHLYFGTESKLVGWSIPEGPYFDSYKQDVYVRVTDTKGAVVERYIDTVQVKPMSKSDIKAKVKNILSSDKSNFNEAIAEGDLWEMVREFLPVVSGLNILGREAGEIYTEELDLDLPDTGYGPTFENSETGYEKNSLKGLTKKEIRTKYENGRDQRGQIRTSVITALAGVTKSDLPSIALVASSLVYATSIPSEVSRPAQKMVKEGLIDMVDTMEDLESTSTLEDIYAASNLLIEIAGNTLEAMRYELSSDERGTLADKELAKTTSHYKYEISWKSTRKEINDGLAIDEAVDDLAGETNTIVQGISMEETVDPVFDSIEKIGLLISKKMVADEDKFESVRPYASLSIQKARGKDLANQVRYQGSSYFGLPPWCTMQIATPRNVFPHLGNNVSPNSGTLSITFTDGDNEEIPVKDSPECISINIAMDPVAETPSDYTEGQAREYNEEVANTYNRLNVSTDYAAIFASITTEDDKPIIVYARFKKLPNDTTNEFDFMTELPACKPQSGVDPWLFFLDKDQVNSTKGLWYFLVRPLAPEDRCKYDALNPPPLPKTNATTTTTTTPSLRETNYTMDAFFASCNFRVSGMDHWSGDGCEVLPTSTKAQTSCCCNHLTTFGSGWVVAPNTLDFDFIFSNMDFYTNPSIYIMLIVISAAYILCALWARHADRKDAMTVGVTPMPDNKPGDKYLYEIILCTGLRKNAGTDSKVHFILSGEYDETDVRILGDEKRKILRRGSKDAFLMSVPHSLGPLNYARIWHDNSGKGKFSGWYLNYFIVNDLQTRQKHIFICNRWLAVEEDDGQVDRLLPVASEEQKTQFGHMFPNKAAKNLGDDHLWFSVIARPPSSRFTRLQRVSCCLCLLFTSMLANALFYEKDADGGSGDALSFGPFALTPAQIYIGVISNLVSFPINFLVAWLFRKSRPRRKRKSRIRQAMLRQEEIFRGKGTLPYEGASPATSSTDLKPILEEVSAPSSPIPDAGYTQPLKPASHEPLAITVTTEPAPPADKKKPKFALPWWCRWVGWAVLWLSTLLSMVFVMFYGIQFGDLKTKKWITSMMISLLTSIFLTQPIKVFLLALLMSILFKKSEMDDEDIADDDEEYHGLEDDETWLHPSPNGSPVYDGKSRTKGYNPPDTKKLEEARLERLKELQMYDILRELLVYSFFLWILLVISYGFRDPAAFFYKKSLTDLYVDNGLGGFSNSSNSFEKMRTWDNYFEWCHNTMIPGLRADKWYNGLPPFGQRGFVDDRVSRIMGYATLRQLRTKPDLCKPLDEMSIVTPTCNKPYSIFNEETGDYGIGWSPLQTNATYNNSAPEFIYRTSSEMDSYPFWAYHGFYSGGGYVVELTGEESDMHAKIDELIKNQWIDRHTRAIFLEFTTYNPMVNLFGICNFVAEFIVTGGIDTYYRVDPVNLLGFFSSAMLFQLVCQIIYLVFIIVFIVKEARKLSKSGFKVYVKEAWNWVEVCIIGLSLGGTVIYFYRYVMAKRLTELFAESGGNAYMNFRYVGYWNELLLYMVGWLVFLATVKFIRLLRFNKRMGVLASTLRYAAKSLFMFGIMFMIVFMAYAMFFYLIYFMELINFSNIIFTMETLLQMLVGKFNFSAMQLSSPVLGPLFFFCYVVTVYYILINMFLTILSEAFSAVRADVNKQSNEYEMVDFIFKRFMQWTGFGNILGGQKKKGDKDGEGEKVDFDHQIDQFPETVDRLMNCISKVYFDYEQFEKFYLMASGKSPQNKEAMKVLLKKDGKGALDGGKEPTYGIYNPNAIPDNQKY
ncbi:hypothetical protein CAPTEDRAFT_185815 [Capitella teleta]|uniref:Polycystin-1 n=1 Tax=Capitella teleta TaxID=283909 RepID=R7UK20_CAPTE|nr:hypothetical protein CAPTEDRAFT_185815 [Capitella teleta]|eukprot:ELU06540.1 hypothetical protein CAPTEDRAFT_185815 [Capitella teleta]